MAKSSLLRSAFGAGLLAAACASSPAHALEPKQCLPMAEMNAALKADGQRTMIIGDRMAVNDAPERSSGVRVTRYLNTVSSNADGSLGYQLEGDLPRAQASTKVCVAAKLTNVRLYDARKESIPSDAFLGGQFDAVVRDNAAKGTRPMVIADTLHDGANGSRHTGLPLVVFGNVAGRSASITTRLPDGKPPSLFVMGDTDYTQAALLKLGTQVAMLNPK